MINFLYPQGLLTVSDYQMNNIPSRILLATDNERVDFWNQKFQDLNPAQLHTITSRDTFAEIDDHSGYLAAMLTTRAKLNMNNPQVPSHHLKLKTGDLCMITRNLKSHKLASNSRVIIIRIHQYFLNVMTLDEETRRHVMIPRIRFRFQLKRGSSFHFTRIQFPVRLAYAITINRAQGQTVDYVGLDLTVDCFMHGQLYVALSRVRRFDRIALLINTEMVSSDEAASMVSVQNVIYETLILK